MGVLVVKVYFSIAVGNFFEKAKLLNCVLAATKRTIFFPAGNYYAK